VRRPWFGPSACGNAGNRAPQSTLRPKTFSGTHPSADPAILGPHYHRPKLKHSFPTQGLSFTATAMAKVLPRPHARHRLPMPALHRDSAYMRRSRRLSPTWAGHQNLVEPLKRLSCGPRIRALGYSLLFRTLRPPPTSKDCRSRLHLPQGGLTDYLSGEMFLLTSG